MMDKAVKRLEEQLGKKLGFISPEAMQEVVKVQHMPPANRLGQKHMELDLTRTIYHMNNIPFIEYRFFAIAQKFDYAITEVKDGETRTGSDVPLLYDAEGGVLSVDK